MATKVIDISTHIWPIVKIKMVKYKLYITFIFEKEIYAFYFSLNSALDLRKTYLNKVA